MLDPAMSNFDTLGRGWAWGLVALAILLGKTPPPPPPLKPNTKTLNTKPTNNTNDTTTAYCTMLCHRHRMLHYATSRHAMLLLCHVVHGILCKRPCVDACHVRLLVLLLLSLSVAVVVVVGFDLRAAVGSGVFQKREGVLLRRKRAYGDLGRTSGTKTLHNHNQTTAG